MFKARKIESHLDWCDSDGIKIYTVSADGTDVDLASFNLQLLQVKLQEQKDWKNIPAFVIFHKGESLNYLVLAWWDNGNELFTSVSVECQGSWICDATKYSFCLYDIEIIWSERNVYIETIDCESPSLPQYRNTRLI